MSVKVNAPSIELEIVKRIKVEFGTRARVISEPSHDARFEWLWDGPREVTVTAITVCDDGKICIRLANKDDFTLLECYPQEITEVLSFDVAEERPSRSQGEWIEWDFSSKDGPDLPEGARVYVRFRDGTESVGTDLVCRWNWRNDGCSGDIMAYRIVKE